MYYHSSNISRAPPISRRRSGTFDSSYTPRPRRSWTCTSRRHLPLVPPRRALAVSRPTLPISPTCSIIVLLAPVRLSRCPSSTSPTSPYCLCSRTSCVKDRISSGPGVDYFAVDMIASQRREDPSIQGRMARLKNVRVIRTVNPPYSGLAMDPDNDDIATNSHSSSRKAWRSFMNGYQASSGQSSDTRFI